MILEYHVCIIDPQKRNLNLNDITKKVKNWHNFSEWNNGNVMPDGIYLIIIKYYTCCQNMIYI